VYAGRRPVAPVAKLGGRACGSSRPPYRQLPRRALEEKPLLDSRSSRPEISSVRVRAVRRRGKAVAAASIGGRLTRRPAGQWPTALFIQPMVARV